MDSATGVGVPTEAPPEGGSQNRLSRRALGFQDITASTIANMAPAFSVFFGLTAMVAEGGLPLALTLLIGAVAIALLCSTLAQFWSFDPVHRIVRHLHRQSVRAGDGDHDRGRRDGRLHHRNRGSDGDLG